MQQTTAEDLKSPPQPPPLPALPADLLNKADQAFKAYSKEKDGYVLAKDLPTILQILGNPMTEPEVINWIDYHGVKDEGQTQSKKITYPKFLELLTDKFSDFLMRDELMEAFRVFDQQKKGSISVIEFRYIMRTYGDKYTVEQAEEIIKECEPEQDQIKYEKFIDKILKVLGIE